MNNLVIKSENQILGDQIGVVRAKTGLNDINPGSVLLTLLEINAQELFQQYVQLTSIIRNFNLDTTTGADLDNKAAEFGLTRKPAQKATGKITISRDSTFAKVSTSLYSGLPAPVVGATKIRVNDASDTKYGTSGTLIVGRGTSNEEEVTYSVAPVNFTNYWEFTASPCSNNHGLDETVILKQGVDESIIAGTVILVPASGSSPEIKFTVDHDTTLLAGEANVTNVEVTCTVAGIVGNIPVKAITGSSSFSTSPFSGAQAENSTKFTTGRDREIDDDLRNRIKDHIQSLSKATKKALKTAIVGLVDPETAKRVVSANIILPTSTDEGVKIYIDDGTGFEPTFKSQGLETVLDQATGGETRLQLDLPPLVKAQVESNAQEPYDMSAVSLTLSFQVGTQSETITFSSSDFSYPNAATAEELVTAINNRANLIEARTSEVGAKLVVQAITDTNEDIQVTGGTANSVIQFPTDSRSTLYLYIDDELQSKDGATAYLDCSTQEKYDFSSLGAGPWPLNITIDGKTSNPQVVNFNSSDFSDPAQATAEEVAAAVNNQLAGAEATVINGVKVRLTSNKTLSSGSKIHVTGGSANGLLGFSTVEVVGANRDYVLNRDLGSIELVTPMTENQSATCGSNFTRAKLTTSSPESYSINSGETLVVSVDGGSNQTVTFSSTGLTSASAVCAIINAQLFGATATVRAKAGSNYVELTTNSYDQAVGSIRVQSSSTCSALNFSRATTISNQRPHRAFTVSQNTASYSFVRGHNLVVVIDDTPESKTFTVTFDYSGAVTTGTSTTQFAVSSYNVAFPNDNDLKDYYIVAKSGANTTTGVVSTVSFVSGTTWKYAFSALPTNLASMAAGDHVTFSGLQSSQNNGNFLITVVNTTGNGYIEVVNSSGLAESGSSGSALIGQRRQISSHTGTTGAITVSSAFRATFATSDQITVIPYTLKNTIEFLNNKTVTTLSTKAFIEAVSADTKVQISSQSEGSDGYVQVTGGSANTILNFSTTIARGLQGYNYYRGLLWEVFKTIYGDDTDPITYEGVGAAGIQFRILAPTKQEIPFSLTLTLAEGISISNVEDSVRSAITGYVNSLDIGEDVIRATVIQKIMEVDNIKDVVLTSPASNVVIADDELAKTTDALIAIG